MTVHALGSRYVLTSFNQQLHYKPSPRRHTTGSTRLLFFPENIFDLGQRPQVFSCSGIDGPAYCNLQLTHRVCIRVYSVALSLEGFCETGDLQWPVKDDTIEHDESD